MTPKFKSAPSAPLAANNEELVYINDHTYIPEPPMEDGRRKVWYGNTPIP